MNVDRLNRYCVKLVKRLNVVSRKGKILSKIYKIYIWNNKYCYRHWKIINVLKIWYIVVYKNLFYFSFLLVYKSNTLCLRFTNYKSRYTQEKNCFRLKILKAISFFFFYNPGFLCIHLEWSIQQPSIYPEAFETQFQFVVVCHSIRVSSFFLHFFFSLFSLYSLVSSLFVSYIFLINVKYLVVQGLREIIGKLLHRMLGDLNLASR